MADVFETEFVQTSVNIAPSLASAQLQPATRVVNLRREAYDTYIGRAGRGQGGYFGNPFEVDRDGTREQVIELYRVYFLDRIERDPSFRDAVLALRGKRLGCFCKPLACHGDVIAAYLNGELQP